MSHVSSCHLVLHEGARHGTSCVSHELIRAHVEESPFLRVPLCQQRQVVTDRKLHHTVHTVLTTIRQYDPGRHTTCPLYEVPLDTLDITVLWVWFTWVVRLVQLFMSYCLEWKVYLLPHQHNPLFTTVCSMYLQKKSDMSSHWLQSYNSSGYFSRFFSKW